MAAVRGLCHSWPDRLQPVRRGLVSIFERADELYHLSERSLLHRRRDRAKGMPCRYLPLNRWRHLLERLHDLPCRLGLRVGLNRTRHLRIGQLQPGRRPYMQHCPCRLLSRRRRQHDEQAVRVWLVLPGRLEPSGSVPSRNCGQL